MSERRLFFNSVDHDRVYDAESFSDWLKKFFTNGVFEGDLQVTSGEGMTVYAGTGYCNINGKVRIYDERTALTLEAANGIYPRIDTIVVELNMTERDIDLKVVTGDYSNLTEPQPMAPIRTAVIYQIVIAQIYVGVGVTEITQANITDTRPVNDLCGYITGTVKEMDFSQFAAQFANYYANFQATYESDMNDWKASQELNFSNWSDEQRADFDAWFSNIQYVLDGDVAGHLQNEIDDINEGLAGSVFMVHTINRSLYGRNVRLTGSTQTKVATFDSNGDAEIRGVTDIGTLTFTATDDTQTATTVISIPYFGNYPVNMAFWAATVNIHTDSEELYGATIRVRKGGALIGSLAFNTVGEATYIATSAGSYSFELTYNSEPYTESLEVTEETTYSVSINNYNVTLTSTATILEGETVTATNGTDTVTAEIENGKAKLYLLPGEWDVAGIPMTIEAGQTYTKQLVVFAFHYSENDSNPDSANYPKGYSNYGWTPFAMDLSTGVPNYGSWNPEGENADKLKWFYPKSCMLKYDGTLGYYLNEDDESKKEDGTASDVASTSYGGNAMVEWGQDGCRIYWKNIPDADGKGFTFVCANYRHDEDMEPWNHYNCKGEVAKHFYLPKYFGSSDGTRLRSISGGSNYVNNQATSELALAKKNNLTTDEIWNTEVAVDWIFFYLVCCLIGKNMNTQAVFGSGRCASNNTSAIGQGTMNGKGMFYGRNDQTSGVKVFGMENPWGNLWRRIAGLMYVSGQIRLKLTYTQLDGSTVDGYNTTGNGYLSCGAFSPNKARGYVSHMKVEKNYIVASTGSGSETTYYCDGCYADTSVTAYAVVGGDWSHAGLDGGFCCYLSYAVSGASAARGAAVSCKPLAK